MAGFWALLSGIFFGVGSIKNRIDESLSDPHVPIESGQKMYWKNDGTMRGKGGERLRTRITKEPDGRTRFQTVGRRSGIVYEDNIERAEIIREQERQREIEQQISSRKAREKSNSEYDYKEKYMRYCELVDRRVSCDDDRRFIARIERVLYDKDEDGNYNNVCICRKYYLKRKPIIAQDYDKERYVEISEEEFEKFAQFKHIATFSVRDDKADCRYICGKWHPTIGKL